MSSFTARLFRRAALPVIVAIPAAGLASYQYNHSTRHSEHQSAPSLDSVSSVSQNPTLPLPRAFAENPVHPISPQPGAFRKDLPTISAAKVRAANGGPGRRVYVTFGQGVYDVTDFLPAHPGGDHLLLAAGGPLEPYWDVYAQHQAPFVYELLEEHRIGNFQPDDIWRRDHATKRDSNTPGPYANDPVRHPSLVVQSAAPFNAEPHSRLLVATQNTPNPLFYIRNHMPVPDVDVASYKLTIRDADGNTLTSLSMDDLRRFPRVEVAATLQCAGNRRNGLRAVRPVRGGAWEIGAIGNAVWAGARLADVLAAAAGPGWANGKAKHICMEGLDADVATGEVYATSIPVDVVVRHPNVLLAYEMNGEPLPADHGFPVRAVVPGIAGARNVKWLGTIVLSEDESTSRWQRKDYRSFAPDIDWDTLDYDTAPSIQEMPVVSAICDYAVNDGFVDMKGYAWSGDGKGIIRVDVSADGGKSWTAAELLEKDKEERNRVYDWTLWTAHVPIPNDSGADSVELVCKAVDSAYNTQPDDAASIWNLRGLLNNSWHRVPVQDGDRAVKK